MSRKFVAKPHSDAGSMRQNRLKSRFSSQRGNLRISRRAVSKRLRESALLEF